MAGDQALPPLPVLVCRAGGAANEEPDFYADAQVFPARARPGAAMTRTVWGQR